MRKAALWWMRLTERRQLSALFAFALSIRIIYLYQIKSSIFFSVLLGDGQTYDAWALGISQDFWGKQAFFQAPLYPYFLSAIYGVFGHDLLALRVMQMLLGSGACVLLARAASSFFSKPVGLWSGFALAVYGPALFFDGLVQKASLDLFLTTALLYFLARAAQQPQRRFPAFAGMALGYLSLTRENALVWLPVLVLWLALREARPSSRATFARSVLPFALGSALVLTPVALRNYAVSGEFFLTTSQFGQNFYIGNNPKADGTYESLRFGHGGAKAERQDAVELAEAASGRKLSSADVSRYWSRQAAEFIGHNPGRWLGLMAKKWLLVWNARELPDSDEPLVYEDESWLLSGLCTVFSFGALFPLALAGAVLTWRRRTLLVWHALSLSLAASTALFFVFGRYRYPLVPLLMPFAVSALIEAVALFRAREARQGAWLALTVAVGLVLTHLNLAPEAHPRATAYYDVAVSLEGLERWNDARASYRDALAANPDFTEAHVNLGSLLARAGEFDEAALHEREALRLNPSDALAHADLGNIYFEQRRFEEAVTHYQRALLIDPHQQQAVDGLAAVRDELKESTPARP